MEHTPLKGRPWMPLAMAALGHIIWGFSVLFSKVAMEVAQPDVLLSIRFLLSALLMTLMILFGKAKLSLRGKNLKPLLLLAVTEPMYFYFESYGILYTNATFAGVVLAVAPVVAILLSVLFLKEYPTRRQAVFCLLPVAGVMLMTVSGSSMGIIRPLGVVFLMGACLTSGAYKTVNRRTAQEFTAFERTYVVMLACAAAFTLSALRTIKGDLAAYVRPLSDPKFLICVVVLSLFCSILCNNMVNYAAGKMSVVKLSSLGSLTTLCSMFAGVVLLHEPLTPALLLGSVLILVGIRQVTKQQ